MKYMCNYTNKCISVNGDLSKPEWKTANKVELVDVVTGGRPGQGTAAMLLWNENFLYVAFECVDHEVIASIKKYNEPLYAEDVVEIFIDDDNDRRTYLEIEVNPNNAVLHCAIYNDGAKRTMQARVEQVVISAVKREENKTFYEIAIPAGEFSNEVRAGSIWEFNLYRIDRGKVDEYTALSPTGDVNYHIPERFAKIEFAR